MGGFMPLAPFTSPRKRGEGARLTRGDWLFRLKRGVPHPLPAASQAERQ